MTAPLPAPTSLKTIDGKRFAVYGLGVTGLAMIEFLLAHGGLVIAIDDAPAMRFNAELRESLFERGVETCFEPSGHDWMRLLAQVGALIPSPGVAVSRLILDMASENKVDLLSELDLLCDYFPGRIIAITGTNGKSTTAAWIHWVLSQSGLDARLGGNIGIPAAETVMEASPESWAVWEVSSYQLESIQRFHPSIAIWSNLTPDHLARHGTLEAYREAKLRMLAQQQPGDVAIFKANDTFLAPAIIDRVGADGPTLQSFAADGAAGYATVANGHLTIHEGDSPTAVVAAAALPIPGQHNIENALATILAARAAGVALPDIVQHLCSFRGLPHRIETIPTTDGRTWINDSKATNPDSTLAALQSVRGPFHLFLGGAEKGLDYGALYAALERTTPRSIIVTGPAGTRIALELAARDSNIPVTDAGTLAAGVEIARKTARPGDTILLSPGAPSFDEFRNFDERGEVFRTLVTSARLASV